MNNSKQGNRGIGPDVSSPTTQQNVNTKKKRKRKPRRNPQRKVGVAASSKYKPPLAPVMKVTIRNIFSVDVAQTIQNLISSSNENSLPVSSVAAKSLVPKIVLDETSLKQLVDEAKAAEEALKKWKDELDAKNADTENALDGKRDSSNAQVSSTNKANESNDSEPVDNLATVVAKSLKISSDTEGKSKKFAKNQSVHARVLYMVPSKKTRRRGEKPGVAYLLLTAPAMETQLAPVAELHSVVEEENLPAAAVTSNADGDETKSSLEYPLPSVDHSRSVAKGRFLLQNTLELLQTIASKASPPLVVEESMNTKVWKQQPFSSRSPVDRLAGTVFETEDYQQFFEGTLRREEQRKARPKPTPGGVMIGNVACAGVSGTSASGTDSQPVAALVLHLQKKQEEEKKRKMAKRKGKDVKQSRGSCSAVAQPQSVTNGVKGSSAESGKASASKKRGGNRRIRKNKPSNPSAKHTSQSSAKNSNGG